ncbi:MAG: FAD-binding oxidoreductase [Beijerinckiaceae bacterium]|nr:FAD-binding oxidoreductase [Beijerinckiaceae bacterium]
MTAALAKAEVSAAPDLPPAIQAVLAELDGIAVETEEKVVRKRSRDFFWYSPILNEELTGKSADIVVTPRSEAEVIRIAAACARHRVPLTPRAGATGNYGQAVPLQRGVLMDMQALTAIEWVKPGHIRVGAGANMGKLDAELRPQGWELRMHPSTKRTATIGGFVAGGSGGVGSVTYGGLREPGNILAARIVTVEETPRVIELRGDAAQKINRAYGTTGIITALEMPLAPAYPWFDVLVAAPDYATLLAIGQDVARADGVIKKLLSPIAWPLPDFFGQLKPHCPDGQPVMACMIAESSLESFRDIIGSRGTITLETPTREEAGSTPLYEYTWNHTTLQMLKADRSVTYLQCLFPQARFVDSILEMAALFPDEMIPHCEFIRFGGHLTCSALPVIRYTTKERLYEIIAAHEARGVMIANPHVVSLEDGSRHKRADADQLGFKAEIDPYGLLNPGKMRSYVPVKA